MPGPGLARAVTVASLVLAVALVAQVMLGSGGDYRVHITLDNAGQLVRGNHVKVGGIPVGEVDAIELTADGRARIELRITDDELAPLHRGTVATVRATSLAGIANRYVALAPGPNDAPEVPDGGALRAEDARAAVDLDQVLNTLDPAAQRSLAAAVRGSARAFDDPRSERELNAALEALNPALAQSSATARELVADRRALERLVVGGADAASAAASRPEHLDRLVGDMLASVSQLARERAAVEGTLRRLPGVLRAANATLPRLRPALAEARTVAREARPTAQRLPAAVRSLLVRVAPRALPEVRALRGIVDARGEADLVGLLRRLPALARSAPPAFGSTTRTLDDAMPVVRDVRPYTPDVVGGILNGFGGATAGSYDANGHYTRISFQTSSASLNNLPTLVQPGQLAGLRAQVTRRCPGAAAPRHPDGSNPFTDGRADFPCDPGLTR